jgi:uncharacterized membrane protein YqiK
MIVLWIVLAIVAVVVIGVMVASVQNIGPTEVGLVRKRFGRRLPEDSPVAFKGEAGYQADLLMPGFRFKLWLLYTVETYDWVQVPAGEIGVVISQVGKPTPIGAKSARYKPEFGMFQHLRDFVEKGGQKGVQRPVLTPGTLTPFHPVAFMVITKRRVYGKAVSPEFEHLIRGRTAKSVSPVDFGLKPEQLNLVVIEPRVVEATTGKIVDVMGIVTTLEGDPLPPGDIASRIGGFGDLKVLEDEQHASDDEMIQAILDSKSNQHNNYQDFQAFMDNGGRIGLQHDPLLYGAYALNPFLTSVDIVPMRVVEQGEVAVIKSYVGLPPESIDSAGEFKFANLVRPGHRGIWSKPLGTGKYAINPHCYNAEIVPTAILTLNWSEKVSHAYALDSALSPIVAKSKEGFVFKIDLQVQIHIDSDKAPMVISMVGTMQNLVTEILQAAVGNHFRDRLQSMPAVSFIETRQKVQEDAKDHITKHLSNYLVQTKGVYIQDVTFPGQLVEVLTNREIANQEIATFQKQREAQEKRVETQKAQGTADMQIELAKSAVGMEIKKNNAQARKSEAEGEAAYISETGRAKGAEVEAVGLAKAMAYQKQVEALGQDATALVNVFGAVSEGKLKFVPDIWVAGGNGTADGLMGVLMRYVGGLGSGKATDEVLDG